MAAVMAGIPMGDSQTLLDDGSSVTSQPSTRILHSWKAIAFYLGRGVRTIQRYELQLGLPIHRLAGKDRSAVLAFADELEQWLRSTPSRNGTHSNSANAESFASPTTREIQIKHDLESELKRAIEDLKGCMRNTKERENFATHSNAGSRPPKSLHEDSSRTFGKGKHMSSTLRPHRSEYRLPPATIAPPHAGLRTKNDAKTRAADVKRWAAETQVEAARLKATTQQVENTLHQVEETAKRLHAKIREPKVVKT